MTTEQQTRWIIGQTVSRADAEAMPVGTVIRASEAYHPYDLTKQESGVWHTESEGAFTNDQLSEDYNVLVSLPSDSEVARFTVGQRLTTDEDLADVPMGTVISVGENPSQYRRVEGGYVNVTNDQHVLGLNLFTPGVFSIVTLPEVQASESEGEWTVGQVLVEHHQFAAVPVGAVIVHTQNQAALYERTEAGYRNVSHGFDYSLDAFAFGANDYRIHSLPGHVEPERVLEVTETFEQYVQRFRVTVLGAAQGSSVALDPIYEGFQSLNAPDPERSVGMYVHYYDEDFNTGLPSGTVALFTEDNGEVTIVGWTGYAWELLSGHGGYHQGPMKVVTMPGVDTLEWATREPTEEDARRIEDFKTAAKVFGRGAKSSQGWCGVYERTMQVMGIDA